MRTSILNTATTEQMGYGILSFFVYIKSTNQDCYLVLYIGGRIGYNVIKYYFAFLYKVENQRCEE